MATRTETRCDVQSCGKICAGARSAFVEGYGISVFRPANFSIDGGQITYDLCPECFDKISVVIHKFVRDT